jgi:hypothetical protein
MELNEIKNKDLIGLSKSELLSLVAEKLKGKVIFPKQIEDAKRYLQNIKVMVK